MQAQHAPEHTYRQCVCSDACGKSKATMLQQQLDERRHITTSKSTHHPEHRTFQSYKQFIISETPSKRLFHMGYIPAIVQDLVTVVAVAECPILLGAQQGLQQPWRQLQA